LARRPSMPHRPVRLGASPATAPTQVSVSRSPRCRAGSVCVTPSSGPPVRSWRSPWPSGGR
jgi:hypothetical protein